MGGLLALARAFGDAYLKSSLQFEGVRLGSDGYSSGFGLTAEPYVLTVPLDADVTHLVVASDGLFNEVIRGGGGGCTLEDVGQVCQKQGRKGCQDVAQQLVEMAVEMGSTDDVTVVVAALDAKQLPKAEMKTRVADAPEGKGDDVDNTGTGGGGGTKTTKNKIF